MPKLHELKERRAAILTEMRAINEKPEPTTDEQTKFKSLETEAEQVRISIRQGELMATMEREADGEPVDDATRSRDLRSYSVAKATRESMNGNLTGIEREYHDEMSRGREVRGVMIPTEMFLGGERRDQTVGNNANGGFLVKTDLASVADRRRPALKVESMGATVLRGLTGDLDLPNLTESGTAAWVAENGAPARSTAKFGKVSMHPRTVAAEYAISRRLMLQSNESVENLLRMDGGMLLATALDAAAINGDGTLQPLGILNTPGIEKVTTEAAFADTTANLIAALELDDVTGSRAFLTNPKVMGVARKLKDGDGHTMPLAELFHNDRYETSTQVPSAIGAGSNKSALIYGEWASLFIGYWSAVDVLVNPYHPDVASKGGALMHFFLDADVAVRHAEAFAYAEI